MDRVEDYILRLPEEKREMYIVLRDFIIETVPGVTNKISYGIPFFYLKKPFCYLHQNKNGGIDLSFMAGHRMSNPYGKLEKRDRKLVRTLYYQSINDIDLNILKDTLLEAAEFDNDWRQR